jgi:hypothetical protein
MPEVVVQFALVVAGPTGSTYVPRACGRVMEDGRRWEGWIEFVPEDSGAVLRTSQETVQPNRDDPRYWATGSTDTYLEGALERALEPPPVVTVPAVPARSIFSRGRRRQRFTYPPRQQLPRCRGRYWIRFGCTRRARRCCGRSSPRPPPHTCGPAFGSTVWWTKQRSTSRR